MTDYWGRHLQDWGTPERGKATMDEAAHSRAILAAGYEAEGEQGRCERRFAESGLDEGMATPYAVFDAEEVELIAEAAATNDVQAGAILADEFGYGSQRVAEALDAMNRLRAGGPMALVTDSVMPQEVITRALESDGSVASALGFTAFELEVVAEAVVAHPAVRGLTLCKAFTDGSPRSDEAMRAVHAIRSLFGMVDPDDGGHAERAAERYAGGDGPAERVYAERW